MEFMENNENQRQKAAASRFSIVQGDITTFAVDAIANAANTSLLGGGGVDGAIHRAAGPELLAECRTLGGCATGQAKLTGGYRLPAHFVLHTPGPVWNGGGEGEESLLKSCYESCLKLAAENGCKTVAFPSISTGIYGFPLEKAAPIAVGTILRFLEDHQDMEVQMVCFDGRTRAAYEEAFKTGDKRREEEGNGNSWKCFMVYFWRSHRGPKLVPDGLPLVHHCHWDPGGAPML